MADRRASVRMELTDNFSSGLVSAHVAAQQFHNRMERDAATWEPHDWSEWP